TMSLLSKVPRKFHLIIFVRFVSLAIQAVSHFIPDHNAGAFKLADYEPQSVEEQQPEPSPVGWVLRLLLDGYHRWDSVHFVLIARRGYVIDHSVVFFPLYPMLCRAVRFPLILLLSNQQYGCLATETTVTLLACYCVNFCLHLLCVHLFWHLTELYYPGRPGLRLAALTLLSVSPATPFFVAFYSEPAHLLCSLWALSCLRRGQHLEAGLALAAAGLARSNGLANALLVAAPACVAIATNWRRRRWQEIVMVALRSGALSAAACSGFLAHQLAMGLSFCWTASAEGQPPEPGLLALALARNYSLRGYGQPPAWCSGGPLAPMTSYFAVQARDWRVGLFSYYEWRQAPNFLLAAPALALSVGAGAQLVVSGRGFAALKPAELLGQHAQLVFLGLLCLTTAHVQIATRVLLSASPLPYWLAASHVMLTPANSNQLENWRRLSCDSPLAFLALCLRHFNQLSVGCRLLIAWCLSYCLVGTAMHANFLPWT
ncbi:hypothetical protein BOX15_Mlig019556g3, partial [Macrostomum lignano]